MKIDISLASTTIGLAYGFEFTEKLDDELLHFLDGHFVGDVHIVGEFVVLDDHIEVDGEIDFRIACRCDKCNEPFERDFNVQLSEDFYRDVDEYGVYSYSGNVLDLDKAVADNVVLELPRSIYCKKDCKGLCRLCGKNLNEGPCDCFQNENNIIQ